MGPRRPVPAGRRGRHGRDRRAQQGPVDAGLRPAARRRLSGGRDVDRRRAGDDDRALEPGGRLDTADAAARARARGHDTADRVPRLPLPGGPLERRRPGLDPPVLLGARRAARPRRHLRPRRRRRRQGGRRVPARGPARQGLPARRRGRRRPRARRLHRHRGDRRAPVGRPADLRGQAAMSGDRPAVATGLAARADELLADARRAREAGAWGDLRALVSAVLALDPANAEAEALLAGWADRRQMTLMFCDLVGSTAMADDRDPEEMGAILRRYRVTCTDVLERFGGFVEDHQGDGMLVRFGYPEVHEDDARRAVLAGLEVVAAVGACAEELRATHGVELHVRLAVHTDLVLLDNGAVTGPAPNEASRLQGFAPPDAVVVSDLTEALVRDAFELEPIGVVALRGVSRPMAAFVVRGERAAGDAAGSEAPGPFVGRRAEREQIAALWQAAVADRRDARPDRRTPARAVLVTGGPGIGKSRLVREAARAAGARCAECRCSSFHETTSLFPFRRLLERAAGIEDGDEGERRLAK